MRAVRIESGKKEKKKWPPPPVFVSVVQCDQHDSERDITAM